MSIANGPAAAQGYVAPGFEPVLQAFEHNLASGLERGAACAIYQEGEKVVDLWGGEARPGQPWQEDTLLLVFSLSKGITGLTLAHAHSSGLFELDGPVADIWPEFAAAGKSAVTVRQLLNQQVGLCAVDSKLTAETMSDGQALASELAAQAPAWPPGEQAGNHAHTLGWLASELIQRTDPKGRTLGRYLAEEIAQPLGCEFYLGLPDTVDERRLADIDGMRPLSIPLHVGQLGASLVLHTALLRWTLSYRTWNNPAVSILKNVGPATFNVPEFWRLENGGAGGIGNARSIAGLYGEYANGAPRLGLRQETLMELAALPRRPTKGWFDPVIRDDVRYSLCFEKPAPNNAFGTTDAAYGTFAIGGSYAFADPASRSAYCYATNNLGYCIWGDPRELALRSAYQAVVGSPTAS